MSEVIIRPIKQADDKEIAQVIRSVLIEMGVPKVGTAYADVSLDTMYTTYQNEGANYFVAVHDGKLCGGAGIAQLQNYEGAVCELQKMYFLNEIRGRGIGRKMIDTCLDFAKKVGYEKVYIETMPYMQAAQELYKKSGFYYLDGPLGDTGHSACPVHMLKDLH